MSGGFNSAIAAGNSVIVLGEAGNSYYFSDEDVNIANTSSPVMFLVSLAKE